MSVKIFNPFTSTFDYLSDTVLPSALTNNLGLWNANTNTPVIVSSVGTAGDWYKVSVSGSTSIDGISTWVVDDYIWFDGDTNTWQRIIGNGQAIPGGLNGYVQFNNSGTFAGDSNLFWNNTNKRLGIGTATPNVKLTISGNGITPVADTDVYITGTGTYGAGINLNATGTGGRNYAFFSTANGAAAGGGKFALVDKTALANRFVVDSAGNFGIGVNTPTSKLQVNGGIQCANDTDAASASKVCTTRYRADANNSYVDMCMQTGAATYDWVNIVTNTW